MVSQNEFLRQYAESTAYHEAGHMVAAVLQGLPVRGRGIHIDTEVSGVAYYCHRKPGGLGTSEQDRLELQRTIIALYAGRAAQETS